MNQNQTESKPESAEQPAGKGLSSSVLFADLVRLHGEENGGLEDFYVLDETTIGCRYGDCCIRLKSDGWHYGGNVPAHPTPTGAFENRASDYHSANDEVARTEGEKDHE
jgi:hypothetical protein